MVHGVVSYTFKLVIYALDSVIYALDLVKHALDLVIYALESRLSHLCPLSSQIRPRLSH